MKNIIRFHFNLINKIELYAIQLQNYIKHKPFTFLMNERKTNLELLYYKKILIHLNNQKRRVKYFLFLKAIFNFLEFRFFGNTFINLRTNIN